MKRLKLASIFIISTVLGLGSVLWYVCSSHYLVSIPVTYNENDHPFIPIQIENRTYEIPIKIGSRFPLFLNQKTLEEIHKVPSGITEWQDTQDGKYEAPAYLIPKITVGELTVKNVIATQTMSEGTEDNALGKYLGGEFNLLLDFPHSRIVPCHSFSKLKAEGFATDDWIQIPLEAHRTGVVFNVETDIGTLKFLINTGLKLTVIRKSLTNKQQPLVSSIFYIGKRPFTDITLHPTYIPECLNDIDGFIGMDFLKKCAIYLNYSAKIAYIEPPQPYFERLPILFESAGVPMINISIEEKDYCVGIDFGNGFPFSFSDSVLEVINKIPYGNATWLDFKGNQYKSDAYIVPEVRIGGLTLSNKIVNQTKQEFYDSVSAMSSPYHKIGTIGLPILKKYNLFLDFPHSAVYAVNDYHHLQKASLLSNNLLSIPFTRHQDGILISVQTDMGEKNLILDTGCNFTFIRGPAALLTSKFCLGGHDFGARSITPLAIDPSYSYDGFLGMDFLVQYPIFIDYINKCLILELKKN